MEILAAGRVLFLCGMYICISAGMINFNKYLMHKDRFPHPLVLTACHMVGSTFLAGALYCIRPSMFPAMESTRGRRLAVYRYLAPIALLFAIMLYGSNSAYLYCSVAFLQFMKESNVVLVFLFSCLAGLQTMNRCRLFVIAWVITGGCLCVSGEMRFALLGFVLQLASQFAECARTVAAEFVLKGSVRLDPLTYTMMASPICLVFLLIGTAVTWDHAIVVDMMQWYKLILPNSCLAFVLNVWIALVIKETSAVSFILTGIVKDIALVVFSAAVFHDTVTTKQWASFIFTLSGVFFWSFMKVKPDHPVVQTFERWLGVPSAGGALGEASVLLTEKGPTSELWSRDKV